MEEDRAVWLKQRVEEMQTAKKKQEEEGVERVRREGEKAKAERSGRGVSDAGAIAKPSWMPAAGDAGDRFGGSRTASGVGRAGKQKQATASGVGEAVEPSSSVGDAPEPSPLPKAKPPPPLPPAESLVPVPGLPGPVEQRGWLNGWDTCYANYGPGGIFTGIECYERERAQLRKASLFKEFQAGLRDPSR